MNRCLTLLIACLACLPAATAHPGIGIVLDSAGTIFYTDLTHVWKITPDGERTIAVRNVHTHELYLDAQGNLYGEHEWYEGEATDKWGNYVWCLSRDGLLEKVIPDVEGFLDNTTLVRDSAGNSYWAAQSAGHERLHRDTPDGETTVFTPHRFRDIRWMHYSAPDHQLYVVDVLTIKRVNPVGEVTVVADDLKENRPPFEGVADRHYIFGLWTDTHQNLYVALYGAGKVKKIGPDGRIATVFESPSGWSPCGGTIAPDGTLWLLEFSEDNTTRVRKITPGGVHTLYGG